MNPRSVLRLCPVAVCVLLFACASPKPPAKPVTSRPVSRPTPVQRATVSLEQIRREAAVVEVSGMRSIPLAVSLGKTGWSRIPSELLKFQTAIFASEAKVNGVADYKVTKGGYLVVACNYDYQGNDSGNWVEERWTRAQFYSNGWRELVVEDLGGALVDGQNRQHAVFVKGVATGATGRLRCNKYSPPYFIICSDKPAAQPTARQ